MVCVLIVYLCLDSFGWVPNHIRWYPRSALCNVYHHAADVSRVVTYKIASCKLIRHIVVKPHVVTCHDAMTACLVLCDHASLYVMSRDRVDIFTQIATSCLTFVGNQHNTPARPPE